MHDPDIFNGVKTLYPWQYKFMYEFAKPLRDDELLQLLLVANNGSGKSQFILAPCIVWMAVSFDNCLSYVTSSSASQLDTQTERYVDNLCHHMNSFYRKTIGRDVWDIIKRKKTFSPPIKEGEPLCKSYIDLIATDDPGKAEGKHPLPGGKEFGIFGDEMKSVSPEICSSLDRCNGFTRKLYSSSPGGTTGEFYTCATAPGGDDELKQVNALGWKSLRVTYKDCPHIKEKEVQNLIAKHGLFDPLVRSSLFAEFSSADDQVVITKDAIDNCGKFFSRESRFGPVRAGLDLSAGGDETVLSVWHGNIMLDQRTYTSKIKDTNRVVQEIIGWINEFKLVGLVADNIWADDGGVGAGIIGHLKDKGYDVKRVLNNHRAYDSTRYLNRGAELWFNFKRFVEEGQVKLINDPILKSQLANRFFNRKDNEKIKLERKEEAKKKGHPSPDRADACILAWTPYLFGTVEELNNIVSVSNELQINFSAGVVTIDDLNKNWRELLVKRGDPRKSVGNGQNLVSNDKLTNISQGELLEKMLQRNKDSKDYRPSLGRTRGGRISIN
jgi:hypothetical protein